MGWAMGRDLRHVGHWRGWIEGRSRGWTGEGTGVRGVWQGRCGQARQQQDSGALCCIVWLAHCELRIHIQPLTSLAQVTKTYPLQVGLSNSLRERSSLATTHSKCLGICRESDTGVCASV